MPNTHIFRQNVEGGLLLEASLRFCIETFTTNIHIDLKTTLSKTTKEHYKINLTPICMILNDFIQKYNL